MPERPRLHLDFNSPCTPPPIYSPYFTPTSPPSPSSSSSSSSPYSPKLSSTPSRRSSTSSTSSLESSSSSSSSSSLNSPKTPTTPKIIMGAMVFTPEPKSYRSSGEDYLNGNNDEDELELESSLEVPGIVLTEPPRQPSPRLPSPPPKQVVLLAPCSLPIPTNLINSSNTSDIKTIIQLKESKSVVPLSFSSSSQLYQNEKPQFSSTFMKFLGYPEQQIQPTNLKVRSKRNSIKMMLLLFIMLLGCYHLWSTLEIGLAVGLEEASLVL
ncbi:uncharacterized protein L201_001780 [Kwoniella dendrophila CBS 6074]|uniref:Uncharacterized protein n=1 Tax=Kwoniella dendrophila CBS 6074 TaxID=1295534 RepID=A0AAX4JP93_9TREE